MTSWHQAPDGRRFRVYLGSCLCSPCWQARCECGEALSKHDFTAEGAREGALEVMASSDPRPGFGHRSCKRPSRKWTPSLKVRTLPA